MVELSWVRSGFGIWLCRGPGVPPYFPTVWSPNSERIDSTRACLLLSKNSTLLPLATWTVEPPLACGTFVAVPATSLLTASWRSACCCLVSGPGRESDRCADDADAPPWLAASPRITADAGCWTRAAVSRTAAVPANGPMSFFTQNLSERGRKPVIVTSPVSLDGDCCLKREKPEGVTMPGS